MLTLRTPVNTVCAVMRPQPSNSFAYRLVLLALLAVTAGAVAAQTRRGEGTTMHLSSGGRERTALLRQPVGTSRGPWPLVILLHGGSGSGERMSQLAEFEAAADRHGYLLAFPDGVDGQWADGRGQAVPEKAGVDDVRFIADLIARLVADRKADARRVYVAGISNGGMMSQRVGCELADRVAAFGSVAANMPAALAAQCRPAQPIGAAFVLGTADPLMPFAGGTITGGTGGEVLSAADSVALWRRLNHCQPPPQTQNVERGRRRDDTAVQVKRWRQCGPGGAVLDVTVEGGGHTWPGGRQYLPVRRIGPTSQQIDATTLLFDFFSNFSR